MKFFFILTLILVVVFSCKVKKPIISPKKATISKVENLEFYKKINIELPFDYLKIQGTAEVEMGNSLPSVSTTLYFEKNTKIWANVSLLFIPVVRALLTNDTVKVYEKLNKTYIHSNYSSLNNVLGIDFLDLKSTQNLLLGKLFIPIDSANYILDTLQKKYTLTSIKNIEINSGKTKGSYHTILIFDAQFQLKKISLEEKEQLKLWEINYYDRIIIENESFPKNVKIFIKGKKNKEISLEYNTFEFKKMEPPFSIPSNYKKRNL